MANEPQGLFAKIVAEGEEAAKQKQEFRRDTLRLLIAALQNRAIEKRSASLKQGEAGGKGNTSPLTDEETLEIVRREVKKRKEAIELYTKGNRADLAEKEKNECAILEAYLPPQASDEEIQRVVDEVRAAFGTPTEKDLGRMMGETMKRLKGTADAKRVGDILRASIQK